MKSITKPEDFPSAVNFSYLNAANVSLMFSGAEKFYRRSRGECF